MQDEYIKSLLDKYKAGTISDAEKAVLDKWYLHVAADSSNTLSEEERLRTFDEVLVNLNEVASKRVIRLWPRIAAAASIVLALSVCGYFLLHKNRSQQLAITKVQTDVLPGGNKAYLILGNGQRISLTDAKNGTIAKEAGKTIQKSEDGMIIYDDSHTIHNNKEIVYNTVETPRGGQYQVILPDGSKVWLNAASSLKYPAAFAGPDRQVELKGEAYFEVAKDKTHPFRVKTAQQTVEVLGTHFDINSYADEAATATTLLEGSVKVLTNQSAIIIKPGEQAVNTTGTLKVTEANVENVIDWKNGDFYLNRVDLRIALRKIARWYDVEVIYDPAVPENIKSGGWISRNKPLSTVLDAMQRTGLVSFKVENNKVYVFKGKTQTN